MLTDLKVRTAKPAARGYRLTDARGLHLYVSPAGGKFWRLRRVQGGKETLTSLGPYPALSLAAARVKRDALLDGTPEPPPVPTLSAVIAMWLVRQAPLWKPHHAEDVRQSLATEIEPAFGNLRLTDITPPMILERLQAVQARGAVETAHRLRQRLSAAFGYAIAAGYITVDPAASLTRALQPVIRQGRLAALTELDQARTMLQRAEAIPAQPVTRLALRLLALTALRPGELRGATWAEVDGDVWTVPAARMKHTRQQAAGLRDHQVPLSAQASEAIEVLRRLTGHGLLMFPSATHAHRPLSENAIGYMLNRAGYASRQTAHGFRATFSTCMNERYPADRAVIDLMLAHVPKDGVEAAYNRARHMERRRVLAQAWADLLLEGAQPAAGLVDLPCRSGVFKVAPSSARDYLAEDVPSRPIMSQQVLKPRRVRL